MKKTRSILIRMLSLFLVAVFVIPVYGNAAVVEPVEPMASFYLDSYNTYVCAMGGGRIEVWFSVTGVRYMDEIGTLSIRLYESTDNVNWTWIKTFQHEDYSSMLASNKIFYSSCVSYQGVAGRYYKAYVCIWAGKDGDGDSRYMWATSEKAT